MSKPFHRNYRPNLQDDGCEYIKNSKYAIAPQHYIRAFLLIQSDLQKLFDYVEPSDKNLKTYSFRIHELFMRTCIEVESNLKAIMRENIFEPKDAKGKDIAEKNWGMNHYKKVNITHHLSSYKVKAPIWDGAGMFFPFNDWAKLIKGNGLPWYQAYKKTTVWKINHQNIGSSHQQQQAHGDA